MRFAGPGQEHSGVYAILYRSFDHGYIKLVCEALQKSTLSEGVR